MILYLLIQYWGRFCDININTVNSLGKNPNVIPKQSPGSNKLRMPKVWAVILPMNQQDRQKEVTQFDSIQEIIGVKEIALYRK